MKRNRQLKQILLCVATASMMTAATIAINANQESTIILADTVSYTVSMPDSTAASGIKTRTYNSGDKLGFPDGSERSDWYVRTFHQVFVGWTLNGDESKVYNSNDVIDTLVKASNGGSLFIEPKYVNQFELMTFASDVDKTSSKLAIAVVKQPNEIIDTELKESSNFTGKVDNQNREVKAYYSSTKTSYETSLDATFEWNDLSIPRLVFENPLSVLKSADGVTDFSGVSPSNYTYEDLKVTLDTRFDVSTTMNNLVFSSALFTVAQVLDSNYQPLETTVTKPTSNELETKFSFKNPNKEKTFIIRTVLRNYGTKATPETTVAGSTVWTATDAQVVGKMSLTSGDSSNITISKQTAFEYAQNGSTALIVSGEISGKIVLDKTGLAMAGEPFATIISGLPNEYQIKTNQSLNVLGIDFAFSQVTFDKNSNTLETGVAQTLATVNVVHNEAISTDELTSESMANNPDNIVKDGKTYRFVGWNTQSDGSGAVFNGTTAVTKDMIVYAIWAAAETPTVPSSTSTTSSSSSTTPSSTSTTSSSSSTIPSSTSTTSSSSSTIPSSTSTTSSSSSTVSSSTSTVSSSSSTIPSMAVASTNTGSSTSNQIVKPSSSEKQLPATGENFSTLSVLGVGLFILVLSFSCTNRKGYE